MMMIQFLLHHHGEFAKDNTDYLGDKIVLYLTSLMSEKYEIDSSEGMRLCSACAKGWNPLCKNPAWWVYSTREFNTSSTGGKPHKAITQSSMPAEPSTRLSSQFKDKTS